MKMLNSGLFFGGLFGCLAIGFAAYADHVLKTFLSSPDFDMLKTALHYQLLHALILTVLGLIDEVTPPLKRRRYLCLARFSFIIGVLLFCGGIEGSLLFKSHDLLGAVPLGGISFMAGWLMIAAAGFSAASKKRND